MRLQDSPSGRAGPLPADLEAIHDGHSLRSVVAWAATSWAAHTVDALPRSSGGWTSEVQGPLSPTTPLRLGPQPLLSVTSHRPERGLASPSVLTGRRACATEPPHDLTQPESPPQRPQHGHTGGR